MVARPLWKSTGLFHRFVLRWVIILLMSTNVMLLRDLPLPKACNFQYLGCHGQKLKYFIFQANKVIWVMLVEEYTMGQSQIGSLLNSIVLNYFYDDKKDYH